MKLKEDVKIEDLLNLHYNMYQMIGFAKWWAEDQDLDLVLTSLISDRESVQGATRVHGDGRGVDLRVWGWTIFQRKNFVNLMNERFRKIAAIDPKTMEPVAAVDEGDHIHIQCKP